MEDERNVDTAVGRLVGATDGKKVRVVVAVRVIGSPEGRLVAVADKRVVGVVEGVCD